MSTLPKIVPFQQLLARENASLVDESLKTFNAATPSIGSLMANAGVMFSSDQPTFSQFGIIGTQLLGGSAATEWPAFYLNALPTEGIFTFGEALKDYQNFTLYAGTGERFELSAMNMLTHVILDENVLVDSALLEEIVATTAARRRELKEQTANIEAFEARLRSLLTGAAEPRRIDAADGPMQRDAYWTRARGDLQQWFCMGLKDLADVIGVAKATLIYIDRPGRHPRPSTARKVMDLYAVSAAVVGALGSERGRDWLATTGLAYLREGGVAALDRAVADVLYSRRRSEDAVRYSEQSEEVDTEAYEPARRPEAKAF